MADFDQEVMTKFAQRLKAARKAAGYEDAKDFAAVLSVEENRYRHWERGSAQPNFAMLCRICRALDITPNDLLPMAMKAKPRAKQSQSPPGNLSAAG